MNILFNRLKSLAANLWTGYQKLPPVLKIAVGIAAIVIMTKVFWPAAFIAIIAASVVLAVCPDHTDPIN